MRQTRIFGAYSDRKAARYFCGTRAQGAHGFFMPFTFAIIGRPNVGKSTLFNRLVGQKLALAADTPGVTRDRREGQGKLGELEFTIIDTAGLDGGARGALTARMPEQPATASGRADAVVF